MNYKPLGLGGPGIQEKGLVHLSRNPDKGLG